MTNYEVWQIINENGRFLYDRQNEEDNIFKFSIKKRTLNAAIKKIKEIFNNQYRSEIFTNEEIAGEDYFFSVKENESLKNFIMFEVS